MVTMDICNTGSVKVRFGGAALAMNLVCWNAAQQRKGQGFKILTIRITLYALNNIQIISDEG